MQFEDTRYALDDGTNIPRSALRSISQSLQQQAVVRWFREHYRPAIYRNSTAKVGMQVGAGGYAVASGYGQAGAYGEGPYGRRPQRAPGVFKADVVWEEFQDALTDTDVLLRAVTEIESEGVTAWESVRDAAMPDDSYARDAVDYMKNWFLRHFEDARYVALQANDGTRFQHPDAEKVRAAEVLAAAFGRAYQPALLQAAAEELEANGATEWVPSDDASIDDPGPELDAGLTDRYDDEDEYVSELELRLSVIDRISYLEQALDEVRRELRASRPPSIGHNNPPEDIDSSSTTANEVETILASLSAIKAQALKPIEQTQSAIVEAETAKIEKIADSWADWLKKRGEKAVDSAVDWTVKGTLSAVGVGALYVFTPKLVDLAETLRQWLHLLP